MIKTTTALIFYSIYFFILGYFTAMVNLQAIITWTIICIIISEFINHIFE